jgi:hypothetical protein
MIKLRTRKKWRWDDFVVWQLKRIFVIQSRVTKG